MRAVPLSFVWEGRETSQNPYGGGGQNYFAGKIHVGEGRSNIEF